MKRALIASVMLFLFVCEARAATIYVCPSGGPAPCTYDTIQEGINAAHAGDVVQLYPGIYRSREVMFGDTAAVFMKTGVTLRGAGVGVSIVDCDSIILPDTLRWRGIQASHVTGVVIENLTVRGAYWPIRGCGILCDTSTVQIRNCETRNCLDGGIIVNFGNATITGCRMVDNINKEGGGLLIDDHSTVTASECVIAGNGAPEGGGVMVSSASTLTLSNTIVSGNYINQTTGHGGGVATRSSTLTLTNCLITNNNSSNGGGGVRSEDSELGITNCLIQGNHTVQDDGPGAGILLEGTSHGLISDCTITHNVVEGFVSQIDGGGVAFFFAQDVTLRQCTIANNQTPLAGAESGSGINAWMYDPSSQHLTLEKCIVAYNGPGKGMKCVDELTIPTTSCSNFFGNQGGDAICGTDAGHNFSLNPQFCDLSGDDYRLSPTSPCAAGHHPEGAGICDGSRIGGEDNGCGPVEVAEPAPASGGVRLLGNIPNPFGAETRIGFEIPALSNVRLRIYDVAGRLVRTLRDGSVTAGEHQVGWDGRDDAGSPVAGGIYFCRLQAGDADTSRPLVLTR